ncbi:MAG: hypothetical protein MUF66_03265, partial [Gammaproteobacteria bacterium]|nr:hypothetical protein [Gammaproteobacteria bacterium]
MQAARPRPEDQVDYWKTRYLRGLDELEQKERQWSEVEQLLQRTVGRLAAATADAYPGLLERLRAAGKAGSESRSVAAIAGDLADAALRASGSAKGGTRPETTLAALLAEIELPDPLAGDVAALRRRLEGAGSGASPEASLKDVARLIRRALAGPGTRPGGDGAAAAGPAGRPEQVLVELLQRLGTMEGGQDAVASLRERLARPVPPAELPALIDAVANLIGSVRKGLEEERRGLESFLSDVSARLAELGDSLSRSQADGQASEQGRQSLGEKVRERVAVMRVSVEHARDLDALKQAVRAGLAAV